MPRSRLFIVAALASALMAAAGCGDDGGRAAAPSSGTAAATSSPAPTGAGTATAGPSTRPEAGRLRVIASRLEVPWGLAFLPDGDALFTQRDRATIERIPAGGGAAQEVLKVPGVEPSGEGGLLGLAVSPTFARDSFVYVYFTSASDNRIARVDVATGQLKPVLTGIGKGQIHNGGALAFGPDGKLYAGVGETGQTGLAQDRSSLNGKILRINTDGSVPASNPFRGSPVWSYGHRNVQGLAWDRSGRLWATEFGQNTTDEVNLIRKGHNYGWPVVEGKGSTDGGRFTNPVVTWSPTSTSSPSGAAIVGRDLYVGALAGRTLWRIRLSGARAGRPQALVRGRFGRIRGVAAGPGGSVWFTTSNRDGRGDPAATDDRIVQLGV